MTKIVLITGAGKGLGRALALEFARKGYGLALVSKTPADLKITAAIASTRKKFTSQLFSFLTTGC